MKNVLIHVRSEEALNNYIYMIENNKQKEDVPYSREVVKMIEEFYNNNWGVYLTTIENFKENIWTNMYYINKKQKLNMDIKQINDNIDFMIIRNLGSVERNFNMIANYLDYLIANYTGVALNNPKAMRRGMTKNYLVEISPDDLEQIGMLLIPTKVYDKKIKHSELAHNYTELENYLIKPVTGELSNSLKCLNDIDEEFLRYKEDKVGGWVVQPIKKEIWNGEYQLVFIGGELIYGQKKNYQVEDGSNIPNQKSRVIVKYHPTEKEITIAKNIIKYFSEFYNIRIDICRIDFMKDSEGQPILIEFEMVNPGFFIGYMEEEDKAIHDIIRRLRDYCEHYI